MLKLVRFIDLSGAEVDVNPDHVAYLRATAENTVIQFAGSSEYKLTVQGNIAQVAQTLQRS